MMSGHRWCLGIALLTGISLPVAANDRLAPLCSTVFPDAGAATTFEARTLLNAAREDAHDATFKVPGKYRLFYVYQNDACQSTSCVAKSILAFKFVKYTNFEATEFVHLRRETFRNSRSLRKSDYDDFHNTDGTIPIGVLNEFHVSYLGPERQKLHTHAPDIRRRTYLLESIPAGKRPWLEVWNLAFSRDSKNQPQCVPFEIELQKGTASLSIEIAEIEDGTGGDPSKMGGWKLKLQ